MCCCSLQAQDAVSKVKMCSSAEIPLLRVLMSELTIQKETLLYHLGDEWAKMVTWTLPPTTKGQRGRFLLESERERDSC